MMNNSNGNVKLLSRRQFLEASLSVVAGLTLGRQSAFGAPVIFKSTHKPHSKIKGVQVGTTTYSYRSMPNQSVQGLLKDLMTSGISAVELKGDPAEDFAGKPQEKPKEQKQTYDDRVAEWRTTVSMDKFIQIRKMYNDAGVRIYAWKPNDAFGENNTDGEINYAFKVAKALGASACTTEHPGNDGQTKRLGEIAARHEIYIAYHAHTQASPVLWNTALEQSKWNAINLDIGHWVAAGNPSPIPFIEAKHDRIESMHLKDRTTPADGSKNLPWGEGDTPLVQALQLMRDQHYTFPAAIELEYKISEGSNAVKEVSKCLEYCRKALED